MYLVRSVISKVPSISPTAAHVLLRIVQWVGGLSLSTVILLLILSLTTIILRRKGYGVRLGFFSIIIYARTGSRRFPDGCEVRFTSRIVGFLFGGCRGPWLDISAERFYMRLRPTLVRPRLPRRWKSLLRFLWVGVAAVDLGYWSTFFRNILTRVLAFWIRGLRIRVDKVRVWKDGGSWECKAEQFFFSGHAVGVFGSRYSLAVNELFLSIRKAPLSNSQLFQPITARIVLRKGVEVSALLAPRLFTIFRPRRLAIMDDLRFSFTIRDISCVAPRILDAFVTHIVVELCPGYSRTLRAKLPPSAPATKRPRQPGLLRYWEGNGAIHGLIFRFATPATPDFFDSNEHPDTEANKRDGMPMGSPVDHLHGSENGVFVRLDSLRVEAYGKAADERHEAMTHASLSIRGCSAGSTSVDALSHTLYETSTTANVEEPQGHGDQRVESLETIDKIIVARPEALLWIEDITTEIDVNCSNRHAMRVDVAGNGGVIALDPIGLAKLARDMRLFVSQYTQSLPRRENSIPSLDSGSISSIVRTASSASLQSMESEQTSFRVVCDMRHWTFAILGHGPTGDGDTLAIVASSDSIVLPHIDFVDSSHMRLNGQVKNFTLMHWTQWARTTNIECREGRLDFSRGIEEQKSITLRKTSIIWDLDLQSGLACLPDLMKSMREIIPGKNGDDGSDIEDQPGLASQGDSYWSQARRSLPRLGSGELRKHKHDELMRKLAEWQLTGTNLSISCPFPDGPAMALSVGSLPNTSLDAEAFVGHHVVWRMQDKDIAYAKEIRVVSPLHTMHSEAEKRSITLELQGFRLIMFYDFPFGYLLQDWLLRLRAVITTSRNARLKKRGVDPQKRKKHPVPDICVLASDVEIHFEDHDIAGFYTSRLPLMQDEARERGVREELMNKHIHQLSTIARAQIAETATRCMDELRKKDSEIWIQRVQSLKKASKGLEVAEGYLAPLQYLPASSFVAASLSFRMTMDDNARQRGSKESIRRLRLLDDYELGNKKLRKTRHYDVDAWNSIGFRAVSFDATGVRLRFRDYNMAFLVIDRMYLVNTTMGQAVQATLPPYVAKTSVAIGRRRQVNIVKGLGPTKTFADIHLVIETLQCGFNPAFLNAISEFGKGVSKFFSGGKNPSPRIPWFDTLRVNMHGRMRITAKKFKGRLTSSISPYSMTDHFVDIESNDFEMLTSRLVATEEDPFPISFKFHSMHIRPRSFDANLKSEVKFEFVRVGFIPKIGVLSGDSQDHYFVPFPSKEDVIRGGPGIGKGTYTVQFCETPVKAVDNGFGNYTVWETGLHEIPDFDTFSDYKTRSMILGLDIMVRHNQADRLLNRNSTGTYGTSDFHKTVSPRGASIVHSDAITTLTKVIKVLVHRPISCRFGPRRKGPVRKPPSKTGMSTCLRGLDVSVDAKDLNIMLHNNLEPGHGLFLSVGYLNGEIWKRTEISRSETGKILRTSKLTRRRFKIVDVFSSIRVPGLDLAVDSDDMGKLLTIDKISLSDDPSDEVHYTASPSSTGINKGPSSGFGNEDLNESPFYTFSEVHPLQKGKPLDKVHYDKRLLVDRIRLIWSPVRRASIFAWPDAFKEKTFAMKAAKNVLANAHVKEKRSNEVSKDETSQPLSDQSTLTLLGDSGEVMPALQLPTTGHTPIDSKVDTAKQYLSRRASSSPELVKLHADDGADEAVSRNLPGTPQLRRPKSPPILAMSRPASKALKRQGGSMIDLLASFLAKSERKKAYDGSQHEAAHVKGEVRSAIEVLNTKPKLALYINDCQVAFGSPETSGIVLLAPKAVRVGIVDKKMQKTKQLGKTSERWSDREFRFHLDEANLFTRNKDHGEFDFSARNWVPDSRQRPGHLSLVTVSPISMDLMYISSTGLPTEDGVEEEDDQSLRPSLLFINLPYINMSTNTDDFHAATDVVRKVLMQSMRNSELVNNELKQWRFNPHLLGGKPTSEALDEFKRRINNITRQFMYAGDTFQKDLVKSLLLPEEGTFERSLLRYKAKAKAVATFTRQDQQASSKKALHPTMYVSYSFDKFSWELREKHREGNRETEHAFVEIKFEDLVCRHIFYVGRGSSTEVTFGNISAHNKMRTGSFHGILEPVTTKTNYGSGGSNQRTSRIKASDGTTVAFRWYATQDSKVAYIPIYETLTIQVAPMTAAVTRKLYSSVLDFIFSARDNRTNESGQRRSAAKSNADLAKAQTHSPGPSNSSRNFIGDGRTVSLDEAQLAVSQSNQDFSGQPLSKYEVMAQRGESSILFKYVFIDTIELTASYQYKERPARGVLDFFDLFVTTPSYSYSTKVWTWKTFAGQVRKDLLMTFALRGVSNLAKSKLLPGYSRARRRLVRGAETFKESIHNVLPSTSMSMDGKSGDDLGVNSMENNAEEAVESQSLSSPSEEDEEERDASIDADVADISSAEGMRREKLRREKILKALYGSHGRMHASGSGSSSGRRGRRLSGSYAGSESSLDSLTRRPGRGRSRPPVGPTISTLEPGNAMRENESARAMLRRLRKRVQHRYTGDM